MILKELPNLEWPREKALREGIDKLSNIELLSIFLRTGTKDLNVLDLSANILYHLNNITDLTRISINELLEVKGIGEAKALTILAAIELGKRIQNYEFNELSFRSPIEIYRFFKLRVGELMQEHFYVIFLNTKGKVLTYRLISIGTVNSTVCDTKEVLKWAVKLKSSAIILVHNHPSGDINPSENDILITKDIERKAKVLEVAVLDHIIIGKGYYSFSERHIHYRTPKYN